MKDRARKFQDAAGRRGFGALWMGRAAALLAGAALTAGCSLSVPMNGGLTDETPTGTIRKTGPVSPFSSQMDTEDWRRAKSALDTALDPQGNGASVAWGNPKSGAKGSFVPLAQVYPKGDGICRPFAAHVAMKGEAETVLHSEACRVNSGDWVVGKITPAPASKDVAPKKVDKLAERDTGTQLR
jgi:surface antigen